MPTRSNRSPIFATVLICSTLNLVCLNLVCYSQQNLGTSLDTIVAADSRTSANRRFTGNWSEPVALKNQIQLLVEVDSVQSWARQTLDLIDRLTDSNGLEDPTVAPILADLNKQRQTLDEIANRISNDAPGESEIAQVIELRQINYRIGRRLEIWQAAYQLGARKTEQSHPEIALNSPKAVSVSTDYVTFDVHPTWTEYLLVGEAESVFNSLTASEAKQQKMARRMLARAFSPVLTPTQQQFVLSTLGAEEVDFLREKATGTPDIAGLFSHLETHEDMESGLTAYRLNAHYQNLYWSKDKDLKQLATRLDTHYRNANVRFAVSEDLINRMIPQMPVTSEPVSERILGAQVTGQSQIHNEIRIHLIPDPERIHVNLETQGEVHSVTRALKGSFAVDNQGTARFRVFKRLAFGRNGIFLEKPVAVSSASQQLVGINSSFDSVPILGRVARRLARNKIQSEAPIAERLVRRRVESTASQRIEQEVESRLKEATTTLQKKVLQPLIAMELDPVPWELSTSNDEIVMRYRLAGFDQMAANTARPRSIRGSLFNMQIHQSAVNNMLMRIDLNGRTYSATELVTHLQDILGIQFEQQETEHEAELVFAPFDPIRVDFDKNKVVISLNLKSLRIGKGKRWKNLSVKSTYTPQIAGSQIVLVQQKPSLKLSGRNLKLRDQLAVRTIFEFLFKRTYKISAIPQTIASQLDGDNLKVSQMEVDNGWLGLSVSGMATPQKQLPPSRAGLIKHRR